jgi:hypothetical protein
MNNKEKFVQHKTLLFVVKIEREYSIKFDHDWITNSEDDSLPCIEGTIVYDPKFVWGVGYESAIWISEEFKEVNENYVLELDFINNMFEVYIIPVDERFTGGWFLNEVEWDGDGVPFDYIEEQINIEKEIFKRVRPQL